MQMWVDNIAQGANFGPFGTRRGNLATTLLLGVRGGTIATPNSTHGIFLAHCAIFPKILSAAARTALYNAFVADGWGSV